MAQANALADAGQIEDGRALLQAAVAKAKASPCAASPVVANVVRDAAAVEAGYSDAVSYRAYGSKMSQMAVMSHQMQRSTHTSAPMYENRSKAAMKRAFISAPTSAPPLSVPPPPAS
eukprot:4472205-Prymnesium_polylepis.1